MQLRSCLYLCYVHTSLLHSLSFFGPSKELYKTLIIYKDHSVTKQVCALLKKSKVITISKAKLQ